MMITIEEEENREYRENYVERELCRERMRLKKKCMLMYVFSPVYSL